jgi:hypothetical protein
VTVIKRASRVIVVLSVLVFGVCSSEAALIDRGGGLIYDDVLDVTWLQDANFAATSGYTPGYTSGRMNWSSAVTWAGSLEYYDSVRGVVWDDWRLPTTINAPSSAGFDTTGTSGELAYMYYVNLGYAPNMTMSPSSPSPSSSNYNPFVNVIYRGYWSETAANTPGEAWGFHFHFGLQTVNGGNDLSRAWAVRDGDVAGSLTTTSVPDASVPEPTTLSLFGLGIAGMFFRRKKSA